MSQAGALNTVSSDVSRTFLGRRSLWIFGTFGAILVAYIISLIARSGSGSSYAPIDGWGVSIYEVILGGLCLSRFFDRSWRSTAGAVRYIPIVLGIACLCWASGDISQVLESAGGATPPVPSVSDLFYLMFFPLCYIAVIMLIRGEVRGRASINWIDGAIAGAGVAALCSAYLFSSIQSTNGQSGLATATLLSYPAGDILLGVLGAIGLAMIPKGRRRFLYVAIAACLTNSIGDTFVLLNKTSHGFGYIANAVVWPISITSFAFAMWLQAPRPARKSRSDRAQGFVLPAIAVAAGLIVLSTAAFGRVNRVAVGLAVVTLVLAGIRFIQTVREIRSLTEVQRRMAVTDDITGLGNRRFLIQKFDAFFDELNPDSHGALLLVSLEHFKQINNSIGHTAGDELLQQAGARVARLLDDDVLLVRLGTDELGVALFDSSRERALEAAGAIIDVLKAPFDLQTISIHVSSSIGIALAPEHAISTVDLLRCANLAVHQARAETTDIQVFKSSTDDGGEQISLIEDLRKAIEEKQIVLHFQPQMDMKTGQIEAAEALARWPHPERGMVPPVEFIPLAEDARVMREFTALILDLALQQCAEWRAAGRTMCVSVNLSATNLVDAEIITTILDALDRHGLPPNALLLEITETTFVSDFEASKRVIEQLGTLGITMSIDDFGTGFSSLSYLSELSVGELKLDQSFITGLSDEDNPKVLAIVRATIDMSHALGLRTVAEGIEDLATMRLLHELGCDIAQGYYISKPVPGHLMTFEPDAVHDLVIK